MDNAEEFVRRPHPRKNASWLSILTFCYTIPIFREGFKKTLNEDDITEHLEQHDSQKLGDSLEREWERELTKRKKPWLLRPVFKVFGPEFVRLGFIALLIECVFKPAQPLALCQLMRYYAGNEITRDEALVYSCVIVIAAFFNVMCVHFYFCQMQMLGMKVRVALCSMVYKKTLKLSKSAFASTGEIVNLISNDINRCDRIVIYIHWIWITPIVAAIFGWILYALLGFPALVGILFHVVFIPFELLLGKIAGKLRMKTATKTDERIHLMNEVITGSQVIKMYTWENSFRKLISQVRRLEIRYITGTHYIRGILYSFTLFGARAGTFLSISVLVLREEKLTARFAFSLMAFFNVFTKLMTLHFPGGIMDLGEFITSISRLTKFLLYEEFQPKKISLAETSKDQTSIFLNKLCAKWVSNSERNTLNEINMEVNKNQLIALIGLVGSGKTSLLHVILSELPITSGIMKINGKISYASQEPWVFAGSVRQNILFGESMNENRYKEVVKVCALNSDFVQLPHGDATIVGERGVTLSGGQKARVSLARCVYNDSDIYLLDDPLSAVDTHVAKQLFDQCVLTYLKNKCVVLVTHQLQFLSKVNCIYLLENGEIKETGTLDYIVKTNTEFTKLCQVNEEENAIENIEKKQSVANLSQVNAPVESTRERRNTGKISHSVYLSYYKAGGGCPMRFLVLFFIVITQVLASCTDFFLGYWVDLEHTRPKDETKMSTKTCLDIYTILIGSVIIATLLRSCLFFSLCMNSSTVLHNQMFSNIITAPMRFFNTNTSGRILNRFSNDMGNLDEILPPLALDSFQTAFLIMGILIIIAMINPWLLTTMSVMMTLFYFMKIVYMRTSRSLKRLEGIARSPVFAHLNATIQGLTTIRASGAQKILTKEFEKLQNFHTSIFYYCVACSRGFGFYLDCVCIIYTTSVTFSFLFIKSNQYAGNVGLAISQALALTGMFQWGIRQMTELQNQMTSVERVVEYTQLEPEVNPKEVIPPSRWPDKAHVQFSSVFLKYSSADNYVLKDVNFEIEANEKIGVVGRTGAGKSSLITALFQLTKIQGAIIIDGIDITKVPLERLRSKIAIIPQEPVLFSGTIRKNLDPFNEYSSADLWSALEEVELKAEISKLPMQLSNLVSESGSNFSVGQRQLLCLARAIVKQNKILIMDEATANVDPQTDALIQKTVRKKFINCSVLTIAHRLNTIMDSDKVLVMSFGKVIEYNHPYLLLKDKSGMFSSMVNKTGSAMAKTLFAIAEESFKEKKMPTATRSTAGLPKASTAERSTPALPKTTKKKN